MMRNILFTLAFDGTNYSGWQRQNEHSTIQGTIEECLSRMTDEKIHLHGAGRTDAGVHALGMTANFTTDSSIPTDGFLKGLNSLLPDDIRIISAEEKEAGFHARKSAVGKEYQYHVQTGNICMPNERLYCCHVPRELDHEVIADALCLVVGEHDFRSFEATGSRDLSNVKGRGAVRCLTRVELIRSERTPDRFSFLIAGDGFLRHMVRNIVGTVLEVGKGNTPIAEFKDIITAKNRKLAGPTAPAKGLFLNRVDY